MMSSMLSYISMGSRSRTGGKGLTVEGIDGEAAR